MLNFVDIFKTPEHLTAEDIADVNNIRLLMGFIFAFLFVIFLICYFTSIAIDKQKHETISNTYSLSKRCISWILVVISSALFVLNLLAPFSLGIYPAIASGVALILASILVFTNKSQ